MTTTRRVRLTQHAVRRYQSRVKPALDLSVCEGELAALAGVGAFQVEPPHPRYGEDVDEQDWKEPPDGYLELAPGIWAVVALTGDLHVLLTVMADHSLSAPRRRKRNEARRVERRKKQRKRKEGFYGAGTKMSRKERWR